MVAGSFSFAVMAWLAHVAGAYCSWQLAALARCLLVFLFVGVLALSTRTRLVFLTPARLWLRSLAGSLSLVGCFYALTRLPISTVLTLTNMFPVWVALLAWPILRVFPSGRVWLAVVSGVLGVLLIQQPGEARSWTAFLIALSCSLSTAVAMIGLHRLKDVDSLAVVVHFSGVATIFGLSSFFVFGWSPGVMACWEWPLNALLLGIGLTASLGQIFLTKAFSAGDPSRVSVVGLSQVVFAFIFDLLENHAYANSHLLGMFLIIAPVSLIMRRQSS